MSHLDPCTRQCELEVQRIVHLQGLANQLPDVFTNIKKVTKSHMSVVNAPAHIVVPEGQLKNVIEVNLRHVWSLIDLLAQRIQFLEKEKEKLMKSLVLLKTQLDKL